MTQLNRYFCEDFALRVKQQPHDIAIISSSGLEPFTLTYQQLSEKISACLTLFQQQGLQSGDIILALLPNSIETVVIFLTTIAGGFGFAPLPCTSTSSEIKRWDTLLKPKICFWSDILTSNTRDFLHELKTPLFNLSTDNQFLWLQHPVENWPHISQAKHSQVYLQTSGTTGDPKAMIIDGNRLWSSGCAFIEWHNPEHKTLRFWNYLPMSYLGGLFNLTLIPLACGGSTVIDQTFSGKTFLGFWQTVERFAINTLWFVPSIVRGLLQLAELTNSTSTRNISSRIEFAFIGTAPIDLPSKEKFEQLYGIRLLENFALSETTFFSSEHRTHNTLLRCEGSNGKLLPYVDVKFILPHQNEAQTPSEMQSYEIWVKSPFLFIGYLSDYEQINIPLDIDGFFPTGDLGYLDAHQQLVITGRQRDIIKKGGYLIYLREVEALANQYPGVTESCAVKIEHPFYGESFNLYVVAKDEDNLTLSHIEAWLHANLVQHKWPEKVIMVQLLPKTISGKIMKHLLDNQE